jgi:hypothetical protein
LADEKSEPSNGGQETKRNDFVRKFSVTVLIDGTDKATHENLFFAMKHLVDKAKVFSPDGRFDWANAAVWSDEGY